MGLHLENEVYCVRQVVNTPTIILNNPVFAIKQPQLLLNNTATLCLCDIIYMLVTRCNIANSFWLWCRSGSSDGNVWMSVTKRRRHILKLCVQPCDVGTEESSKIITSEEWKNGGLTEHSNKKAVFFTSNAFNLLILSRSHLSPSNV